MSDTHTPEETTSAAHSHWQALEQDAEFRQLVRKKQSFIIPATIFFLLYYFGFLILVGYFPDLVQINVVGNINIAYLFALSEFLVAWIIVFLYVWQANGFDRLANALVRRVKG